MSLQEMQQFQEKHEVARADDIVDTPSPGVPCSKPLGGSKVDSVFHPSEVDKMSTRNFWELSGKK